MSKSETRANNAMTRMRAEATRQEQTADAYDAQGLHDMADMHLHNAATIRGDLNALHQRGRKKS